MVRLLNYINKTESVQPSNIMEAAIVEELKLNGITVMPGSDYSMTVMKYGTFTESDVPKVFEEVGLYSTKNCSNIVRDLIDKGKAVIILKNTCHVVDGTPFCVLIKICNTWCYLHINGLIRKIVTKYCMFMPDTYYFNESTLAYQVALGKLMKHHMNLAGIEVKLKTFETNSIKMERYDYAMETVEKFEPCTELEITRDSLEKLYNTV